MNDRAREIASDRKLLVEWLATAGRSAEEIAAGTGMPLAVVRDFLQKRPPPPASP